MFDKQASHPHTARPKSRLLTRQEMHDAANARVSLIAKEFTNGFNFIRHYPKSVTIFGSSRLVEGDQYYAEARDLGRRIAEEIRYSVLTGGGPGIMEAANRGAFETGGDSLGLTIELPGYQITNRYLTQHIDFYYFFSRKVCMSFSAEAYVFFPGGLGTLDEFFEIVTLVQTGKIERVPIILVGSEFWKSVDELLKKKMLTRGMIDKKDTTLYTITDSNDTVLDIIRHTPVRNGIRFTHTASEPEKTGLAAKKCVPCEGDTPPLTHEENAVLLSEISGWTIDHDKIIEKTFDFKNFSHAMAFVNDIADIAETEGHHPDIHIVDYKRVRISLTTHAIGGLSENDFIMAAKIDSVRKR